jgi:hypothetical protein
VWRFGWIFLVPNEVRWHAAVYMANESLGPVVVEVGT